MQSIQHLRHAMRHVWSRTGARLPHPRSRAGQRALAAFTLLTLLISLGVAFSAAHNAYAGADINTSALLHDSRDALYRSPGGALPTGQSAALRLRTAANNAGEVTLRIWNTATNGGQSGQELHPATRVFSDGTYDYWQATIAPQPSPRTLWYKWLVTSTDKTQQVWYEDHYDNFLHGCDQVGGVGQTFASGQDPDCSYRLNVYAAGFTVPDWVKHAVIYQIFVDRFFNGLTSNDAINQPLKYDNNGCLGPDGKPTASGYYLHTNWNDEPLTPPQGCDFYGGDLQGIIDKLDYLRGLGVNTLYLNPIFMADSNHKYDTTDYAMIDPHFGNLAVWQQLVQQAHRMGMHIILDGVFNHTSSDSLYFDRYHTWQSNGADETQSSPYEDWYQFTKWPAYSGWFGFDSLPQLTEQQDVRNFIFAGDPNFTQDAGDASIRQQFGEQPLTAPPGGNSIAKYWLAQGADAWRLDVAESKSDGWWQQFRTAIKSIDPEAISIGEHWGDASQWLLGDQQDGTMNYLFRDAVINFFDKGGIDPDTGHDNHEAFTPSQFDAHLQKVLENYPQAAVYSSMNLVDSHDTGRILWELGDTTGSSAAQVAQAKQTLRLIALFQMTWIGAPTIYYGDEAGQTQSTYDSGSGPRVDPGDRRTFPWDHQDTSLQSWYSQWIHVRQQNEVLQTGAEQTLLTDDANRVFAFQRRDDSSMVLVVLNDDTASNAHTVTLNVSNVGDGATFTDAASGEQFTVSNGRVTVPVNGLSGRVLLARGAQVRRPAVPQNVQAFHLNGTNALQWNAVQSPDLAGYNIYRSNIANGLYTKVNASPVSATSYTDQGTDNAKTYYYIVRAVSNQSVESLDSAVVKPVVRITFAGNLSPATLAATLNVKSDTITATVTAPGSTDQSGQGPWITAQIGYGPSGSNPGGWTSWMPMSYQSKTSDGQSDIYSSTTTAEALGTSAFLVRFSGDDGATWTYAYVDHSTTPGTLTVSAATDATPPAAPTGLAATAGAQQVTLTWNAVPNPSTAANIWRYHVARSISSSGPFTEVGTLLASDAGTNPSFTDTGLTKGTTYNYTVTAESNALVKGPAAGPVSAAPHVPAVHVTFNVAIPYYTPSGDIIHIAGDYVNNWDPGATSMSKIDATHWAITMDLPLGKTINYKYTRGSWDSVQKDPIGREINNLQYTLPDTDGAQVTIFDSVASWRDIAPPANAVAVQWNVQVPATTPANAQLYLAGDAWGWSPNGAALRNVGGGNWQYTQIFAAGTTINYKYTRGSWDTVEVDSNFNDIPNRTLTVTAQQSQSNNGFTYAADFQTDSVANWHDHPSAQQVAVTFTVANTPGIPIGTVWDDLNGVVVATMHESLGFPTQRSLAVLERIVRMGSNQEDLVLDVFSGSGTTLVAAQAHARKWIGCDIDSNAYGLCMSRLASQIKLIPGRDFAIGDQAFLEKQFSVVASTSAIATTQRLKRIESRDVEPPESSAEAVALLATLDELKPGRDDAKHVEKTLASLAEYNTFTTPDDFGRTPGLTTSNSVLDRWRDEQIRHLISAPRYSPRIFISYRRDDTAAGHAGRLRADLARRYGKDKVFMDLASEPGVDFVDTLEDAVGSCSALLAVIGRNWLTVTDAKTEKRRLDNPWDWARIEVATALRRNISVIPVLFHHAQMPSADDLPDDLKPLARRNAHEITDSRWEYDTANLVEVLDKIVGFKK